MESNNVSFFNASTDEADESISLNEDELNNILTETVDVDAGAGLRDEPDVIVIDREDLNDGALPPTETVEDIMPPSLEEFEVSEESFAVESDASVFPVSGEAPAHDLSDIPEPAFSGMESGFLNPSEPEGTMAETSVFDEGAMAGSGLEMFQPDEPSAVEEISGLPDIGDGMQESVFQPADAELPSVEQTMWDETTEVTPLDLGLEQSVEMVAEAESQDDVSFADVEEIDLDAEPASLTDDSAAQISQDDAPKKSFFNEEEEDEAITLSSDELNNILDDSVVEPVPVDGVVEEMIDIPDRTPSVPLQAIAQAEGVLSPDNLKEIFVYLDNLLDKLPDGEVRRFAESRYYDLYNAIFEELGLV